MSKMDGLRAMREAKYARAAARADKPAAAPQRKPKAKPAADAAPVAPPLAGEAGPSGEGLCGHRAISGRTCTRELGHAAKSHRYS